MNGVKSMSRKTRRGKALDITKSTKDKVWERDGGCCVVCGNPNAFPSAHYLSRAKGGLGNEFNIVTLCSNFTPTRCHYRYDFGTSEERHEIGERIKTYLQSIYPDWTEENLRYKREGL